MVAIPQIKYSGQIHACHNLEPTNQSSITMILLSVRSLVNNFLSCSMNLKQQETVVKQHCLLVV